MYPKLDLITLSVAPLLLHWEWKVEALAPSQPHGNGQRVTAVATGDDHSMAISDGGEVFTFGEGKLGQLGHGEVEVQLTPRAVGSALEELVTY